MAHQKIRQFVTAEGWDQEEYPDFNQGGER